MNTVVGYCITPTNCQKVNIPINEILGGCPIEQGPKEQKEWNFEIRKLRSRCTLNNLVGQKRTVLIHVKVIEEEWQYLVDQNHPMENVKIVNKSDFLKWVP